MTVWLEEKVHLVLQVIRASQVPEVQMVEEDELEDQASQVVRVQLVLVVILVPRDLQEKLDFKDQRENQDLPENKD